MKHGIELNGVANLTILLDGIVEECDMLTDSQLEQIKSAEQQLIFLERYMIAFAEAMDKGVKPPYWHEVLANPNLYPTNKERMSK